MFFFILRFESSSLCKLLCIGEGGKINKRVVSKVYKNHLNKFRHGKYFVQTKNMNELLLMVKSRNVDRDIWIYNDGGCWVFISKSYFKIWNKAEGTYRYDP